MVDPAAESEEPPSSASLAAEEGPEQVATQKVTVKVTGLIGTICTLSCFSDFRLREVKRAISKQMGWSTEAFDLIHGCSKLKNKAVKEIFLRELVEDAAEPTVALMLVKDHHRLQKDLQQALLCAASAGNYQKCEAAISAGLDVRAHGGDALLAAVQRGDLKILRLLREHRASLRCRDAQGRTPLLCAVEHGNVAMVEELLSMGAWPLAKLRDGRTAMYLACCGGNMEIVQCLLRHAERQDKGRGLARQLLDDFGPIRRRLLSQLAQVHGYPEIADFVTAAREAHLAEELKPLLDLL